jgi:predicted nucleotidyltransferase
MTTEKRKNVVEKIGKTIHGIDPTATAILYGSEARGEARSDSDIDVLILLEGEKMTLKREMEITGPLNEIEWQTGVLVSPTVMLRKQWENMPFKTPFYINVMNEGIKL